MTIIAKYIIIVSSLILVIFYYIKNVQFYNAQVQSTPDN